MPLNFTDFVLYLHLTVTGQGDRRASFRKSVTGSNSINAISSSNGISQRGSMYRQNRNSFKTFSSSKEASFLENVGRFFNQMQIELFSLCVK
jgi:hypothetical protein